MVAQADFWLAMFFDLFNTRREMGDRILCPLQHRLLIKR